MKNPDKKNADTTLPLTGKHAVVTGGGRGIGAAIAESLLAHGAHVTLLGRDAHMLKQTVQRLLQSEPRGAVATTDFVVADVAQRNEVDDALKQAAARAGIVDILINNAGQAQSAPFLKTSEEMWRHMLAVNLTGAFHCTQLALPGMLETGWGRIVNIASTAGLTGYSYVAAYCASKHGMLGLTRALAAEFATKGITVNAVCPGYTDTDLVKDAITTIVAKTGRGEQQVLAELTASNPQQRLIQPHEVANAVAWLCLPGSEAMNGQALTVAGGELMS